jgi:LysR family carnitine catabolism transcriptional activator
MRPIQLSTRQIQAFVLIAAHQSFSQAANVLGVTQPALSLMMKGLEKTLGVSLLDRNTRGVRLTQAGNELLVTAQRILSDLQHLEEAAGDLSRLAHGEVRIACSFVMASNIVPLALRRFQNDYPGVRVTITDTAEQNLAGLVRDGLVDFALATAIEADPRLEQEIIGSDQMAVYLAEGHPLSDLDSITWQQLAEMPLALLNRGSPLRQIVDNTAGRLGLWLDVRYEVTFGTTALALVEQGLAASVLPSNAMRNQDQFRCMRKTLVRPVARRDIMLVRLARNGLEPSAEMFANYCRQEIAQTPERQ